MKKHLEIKTYQHKEIDVMVEINYDRRTISLVENQISGYKDENRVYTQKNWVFIKRGLEYMDGWIDVLDAMKYAVTQARTELQDYLNSDVTEILTKATELVKGKSWTRQHRIDKDIWEDICPHGVGHENGVHGCDGCCTKMGLYKKKKK